MSSSQKDQIYADPLAVVDDFAFDASVAKVFPDMLNRSVPGYGSLVQMIGQLSSEWLKPNSRCYDLGCSLGAVSYAVAGSAGTEGVEIIAVDNAPAMIERLRTRFAADPPGLPVRPLCADIQDVSIEQASLVVLNLTMQFLPPERRLELLLSVYRGLLPGGVLILSEKLRYDNEGEQKRMDALHHGFKRSMGYSDLEISQKRAALEKVLMADTLEVHGERLVAAGFSSVTEWFRCLNFVSLMAVK